MSIRILMLGDVVGQPGLMAVMQQAPLLREKYKADLVIANGENAANGSGITPNQYQRLCDAGVDGITLGDHCYKRNQILPTLEKQSNIIRPANLSEKAVGKTWMRLTPKRADGSATLPNVYVLTVLGRVFISVNADDPFATVDRIIAQLPEKDPIVIVEVHAEATAEKVAMSWHLDGKVAAIIGTHTHVPTADARIMPKGSAAITDIGMSGPHESVIGRKIEPVLSHLITSMPAPYDVAENDIRVNGVFFEYDETRRRATTIERVEVKANLNAPPFAAARG